MWCELRPIMDLIATDASGAIVDMIRRAIDDGHKVAWVGYMRPKPDAEFATCGGEVDLFRQRLTALDAELPSMIFVDGAELGTGVEDDLYEEDGYVPPNWEAKPLVYASLRSNRMGRLTDRETVDRIRASILWPTRQTICDENRSNESPTRRTA